MRARVGRLLRRWADHIDPDRAYKPAFISFTYEETGHKPRQDGRGAPLFYVEDDLRRAYEQSDTDWRTPIEKLNDTFNKFARELTEPLDEWVKKHGPLIVRDPDWKLPGEERP